jgi:hypothetical protein
MKEKYEYDPSKLFVVDIKVKVDRYRSKEALVRLNGKNGNLSFNKKAVQLMKLPGKETQKFRVMCDGFKLYIDLMVSEENQNIITITKSNIGCSVAFCQELKNTMMLKIIIAPFLVLSKWKNTDFVLS